MDHPDLAVLNFMEKFIGQERVNPFNKLNQKILQVY